MEFLLISLSPIKRRLLYVALFEFFGILFSTVILMALSKGDAHESLPVAIIVSSAAVIWNFIYNTGFEFWEVRRQITVRTFAIRCMHATGFEVGLFIICLPLYMYWYDVGLWTAATMEAAILIFFLVYTFIFTLMFDQVFTRHSSEEKRDSSRRRRPPAPSSSNHSAPSGPTSTSRIRAPMAKRSASSAS